MRIQFDGYPSILQRVKDAGFKVFESVDYDMNIIGERNPQGEVNKFDDWIHLVFLERGVWQWYSYRCTTDAGSYWLQNSSDRGTAILVHNRQYIGSHILGLHRGQYEALVQQGNEVQVWRDINRDLNHDWNQNMTSGYFGINIHRASSQKVSQTVDQYSAGCQVIQDPDEFNHFIALCKLQIKHLGYDKFSYTLLLGE